MDGDEEQRLRRYLLALSAVNRQLQAQLDAGTPRMLETPRDADLLGLDGGDDPRATALTLRRASSGAVWLEQLQLRGGASDPFLVRSQARGPFLVEGRLRREIKAGLLYNALTRVVASREITDAELDELEEGPPVEVLEGPSGPAFVVVGGRRLPLRGLPLPHPVTAEEMMFFPEAQELRIGAGGGPPAGSVDRVRALVEQEGPVRGSALVARKSVRRVWRKVVPKQP